MTTQIHHAVTSNPFEAALTSSTDNSEIEIEKILNEIGIFGDDYMMVHDRSWEDGTAISVPSGGLPPLPIYETYSLPQTTPVVKPEAPSSSGGGGRMKSLTIEPSKSDLSSSTKKRKSPSATSGARSEKPQITEVERRERNRQHAKKSRLRKKSLTQVLEQSLNDLKTENQRMREQLYKALGEKETVAAVQSRLQRAQNTFIAALQQPKNRVLDEATSTHLKSLSKSVTKKSLEASSSSSEENN